MSKILDQKKFFKSFKTVKILRYDIYTSLIWLKKLIILFLLKKKLFYRFRACLNLTFRLFCSHHHHWLGKRIQTAASKIYAGVVQKEVSIIQALLDTRTVAKN